MKLRILFKECLQNSQELGTNDEHMVSRVSFSVERDGQVIDDLYCDIKQTIGSDFETGPIEVVSANYNGPLHSQAFGDAVERYYRSCIGSSGKGIRVTPGARVFMSDNWVTNEQRVEIEVSDEIAAGW